MAEPGNHLLKVCDGILAGVYGLKLDEQTHSDLLKDLNEAVAHARRAETEPDRDELLAKFRRLSEEERVDLLSRLK